MMRAICKFLLISSCALLLIFTSGAMALLPYGKNDITPQLQRAGQLILVLTSNNQHGFHARLWTFARTVHQKSWLGLRKNLPAVVGKNGTAWNKLQPYAAHSKRFKHEGDNKTPLGIYPITTLFGFAAHTFNSKMPYFAINNHTEAVDDGSSHYYNRIVDTSQVNPDWHSAEKMWQIPLYKYGANIGYNFKAQPNLGSNIFFHIWRNHNHGTAGCVALAASNLKPILKWLNIKQHPMIIILPHATYNHYRHKLRLPAVV